MYKAKPINSVCVIEHFPTNMYKVNSIYGDFLSEASSSMNETSAPSDASLDMTNLNKDAQSQLRRLNRLQEKVNQFCEDISLSHLVPSTKSQVAKSTASKEPELLPNRVTVRKNNSKKTVEDLVIQIPCNTTPYSLLAAFTQLATKYKCFAQFYVHGSAVKELAKPENRALKQKIESIKALFKKLRLDLADPRNSYDYAVSFIWKKLNDEKLGPIYATTQRSQVFGESAILCFMNRLIQSKPAAPERDLDLMNQCTNELIMKNQQAAYLTHLNQYLGANKFLSFGERPGMADLYVWSMLRQLKKGLDAKKCGKVSDWMKVVEASSPALQMINEA